ncbi:MAG TPA: tetraacyldisaccharide 4'-kinase, partial [Polyangiaceae bacterium]
MRALLARSLEEGRFRGPAARAMSVAWERAAANRVVRPILLPERVPVVCVGGATLGGSGKTPLAVACARELSRRGARTVLVGHAYRARPGCARRVCGDEPVGVVGDEAIVAARALEAEGVWVVVAPTRRQALELAARHADVVVLDGVLQTTPRRAWLSWLAVDAEHPWGNARSVPPVGDL